MNRRHLHFACEGRTLAATLDSASAAGSTGLLIVSGGNEIRAGAWGGQARMAARLAAEGVPVMRYDRRGVGESEGENKGFRGSAADISAALQAFRAAAPHLRRVVAFGNCDAASALALFAADLPGIDALVLANPWTIEGDDEPAGHAPEALRRRYWDRLRDPVALLRLLTGKVNLAKLWRGLRASARKGGPSGLAAEMQAGLARFGGPVTILLAERDRVAQVFVAHWPAGDEQVQRHDSASHSFSDEAAQDWLFERLVEATAVRH
jgi:exosortase A-associated hydrolase 1